MFRIHMLPAEHGDCLWIEYGDSTPPQRMLIDCGTVGTYPRALREKIRATVQKEGSCRFELLVVTHIDADHIGGAIQFLREVADNKVRIEHVWFNGYYHLSNGKPGLLGAKQAEELSPLIEDGPWKWNEQFGKRAVMVADSGALPQHEFSGMKLTLLSPTFEKLQKLLPVWEKELAQAGLQPGARGKQAEELPDGFLGSEVKTLAEREFKQEHAEANGSSIAFLAEHGGKCVLFGADAHPDILLAALQRAPLKRPLQIDAFKLPHHASKNNISIELIAAFPATHYLVSSNGRQFKHPNAEAIARILYPPSGTQRILHFNYQTQFNEEWQSKLLKKTWSYAAYFGDETQGLVVEL